MDFVADTAVSFSSVSGEPFKKLVEVLNKRSRAKVNVMHRTSLAKHVEARAKNILQHISDDGEELTDDSDDEAGD